MKLNIIVDDHLSVFKVTDNLLIEANDFFARLDADMDKGWQMSQNWVEFPTREQRCQIVGNKILVAIETENEKLLMLMVAYILKTLPGIKSINIDNTGDMNETDIVMGHAGMKPLGPILN